MKHVYFETRFYNLFLAMAYILDTSWKPQEEESRQPSEFSTSCSKFGVLKDGKKFTLKDRNPCNI